MKTVADLPRITIIPQTKKELDFFQEMLLKMKVSFELSQSDELPFLERLEAGLTEAKKMKGGKLPKKPLRELYERH